MASKHARTVAMTRVGEWRRNRNSFWRAYKPPSQHCPFTARAIAIAQHFNSKLNSYAAAPAQQQPAADQPTADQPTAAPASANQQPEQPAPPFIGDITYTAIHAPPSLRSVLPSPKWATRLLDRTASPQPCSTEPSLRQLPPTPPGHGNPENSQEPLPSTKDATTAIAQGLHALYARISATGSVPVQWRTTLLVPIYKGKGQGRDLQLQAAVHANGRLPAVEQHH
jgi:hypothetical protein